MGKSNKSKKDGSGGGKHDKSKNLSHTTTPPLQVYDAEAEHIKRNNNDV